MAPHPQSRYTLTTTPTSSSTQAIITFHTLPLLLRPPQPSDAQALAHHANNPKIPVNMRNGFPSPYTLENAQSFIKFVHENRAPFPAPASASADAGDAGDAGGDRERRWLCDYVIVYSGRKGRAPWQEGEGDGDGDGEGDGREEREEVIGSIGLKFNSPTDVMGQAAEVGYWISEEFWGRGWMTSIVRAFVDWTWKAFPVDENVLEAGKAGDVVDVEVKDVQSGARANQKEGSKWRAKGLDSLSAGVFSWNATGSARVLEKCGFRKVGVMRGRIWKVVKGVPRRGDEEIWEILRAGSV